MGEHQYYYEFAAVDRLLGARELILRLPARLLDPDATQRYCSGDAVSVRSAGEHVVVSAVSDPAEFARRLAALWREHGRKVTFDELLEHAGL